MTRLFDVLFSFVFLLLLLPVSVILAVIIKLNSKGPVFYKQVRVGKNNTNFNLYKFRTMHLFSDRAGLLTVGNTDPRITSAGFYIRKYKLDELPQMINVLKGDMSIVGPRPEVRKYVDLYNEDQRKILNFRPGITDYASILYSNENEILAKEAEPEKYYVEVIMPRKIEMNMKYLNNPSLQKYLTIVIKTLIKLVIKLKN